jgi:hypothetical protein
MKKHDWIEVFTLALIILWAIMWILFMVLLNGCTNTVDTPVFDSHQPVKKIVIECPPQRIVYFGSVTKEGESFAKNCLREMHKKKYHNYKFNETTTLNSNIQVNSSNLDSESLPVNQN